LLSKSENKPKQNQLDGAPAKRTVIMAVNEVDDQKEDEYEPADETADNVENEEEEMENTDDVREDDEILATAAVKSFDVIKPAGEDAARIKASGRDERDREVTVKKEDDSFEELKNVWAKEGMWARTEEDQIKWPRFGLKGIPNKF